jgi:hypothetical protein
MSSALPLVAFVNHTRIDLTSWLFLSTFLIEQQL